MNLSLLLSRIGIRPRIFGGFALILAFLTVVALLAVSRLAEIGGTVGDLVSSADGDAGMARVHAALLSANTAVEKFIRTRNLGDRDAAAKAIDKFGQVFDGIEQRFGNLPAIAAGRGVLADSHDVYRKSFAAVAAAVDHLRNASTKADALGARASLDFAAINVALANQPERLLNPLRIAGTVDAVRVAMLNYMMSQTQAAGENVPLAIDYALGAIADTEVEIASIDAPRLKTMIAALMKNLTDQSATLKDLSAAIGELRKAQADIAKASGAIDDETARISRTLGAARREQSGVTSEAVEHTRNLLITVAVIALALGALLAWLIGRSVSRPITEMTSRMQSLAAGELDEAIPGGARGDEIGHMASAVEVFRQTRRRSGAWSRIPPRSARRRRRSARR